MSNKIRQTAAVCYPGAKFTRGSAASISFERKSARPQSKNTNYKLGCAAPRDPQHPGGRLIRKVFLAIVLYTHIEYNALRQGVLAKKGQVAPQLLSLTLSAVCCGAYTNLTTVSVGRFLVGLVWVLPTIKAPGQYGKWWALSCVLWYGGESLLYTGGSVHYPTSLAVTGTATTLQLLIAGAIALRMR